MTTTMILGAVMFVFLGLYLKAGVERNRMRASNYSLDDRMQALRKENRLFVWFQLSWLVWVLWIVFSM